MELPILFLWREDLFDLWAHRCSNTHVAFRFSGHSETIAALPLFGPPTSALSQQRGSAREGVSPFLLLRLEGPTRKPRRCPSTVRPVFPVLVFQLSKQQNRTRTTPSTVVETPPNRTRTKKFVKNNPNFFVPRLCSLSVSLMT